MKTLCQYYALYSNNHISLLESVDATKDIYKHLQKNLQTIINNAQPLINKLVDIKVKNMKDDGYEIDDSVKYAVEYALVRDLCVAFGNYVLPNDEIKNVKVDSGLGASGIVIECDIVRGNETFQLKTKSIDAGGHNIQKEHARYIITTQLPKLKTNEIEHKLKSTNKKSKVDSEIAQLTAAHQKKIEEFKIEMSKTDEEIYPVDKLWTTPWNKLSDAEKKNWGDEETFKNIAKGKEQSRQTFIQNRRKQYNKTKLAAEEKKFQEKIKKLQQNT